MNYIFAVVTEYKNKIDKLLTDTQKAYEADKEKFKDVMESCIAMKQQSSICQVCKKLFKIKLVLIYKACNYIHVTILGSCSGRY